MEYPKFKVCVRCFTFNHSKYITDAMNGFVMQQTDFPYVCCIVDDASKDGEQEVIRKYVSDNFDLSEGSCHFERETDYAFITYAQHKTNKNCYFAVLYLKENHYSIKKPKMPYLTEWQDGCEYHALCEGDDYWIDENKLQKQVDFMDSHKEYSLCFHKAKIINEGIYSLNPVDIFCFLEDRDYSGQEFLEKWTVPTASSFYRSYSDTPPKDKRFIHGDIVLWVWLSLKGKCHCMKNEMSIYRRQSSGALSVGSIKNNFPKWLQHYKAEREWFGDVYGSAIDVREGRCCAWGFCSKKWSIHSLVHVALHPRLIKPFLKELKKEFKLIINNKRRRINHI